MKKWKLLIILINFNFDIPFIGGGNISKGIISLEVPYVNKIVALNQTDLEVLKNH